MATGQVRSAAEAERVSREFLASRLPGSFVYVNRVVLNKAEGKWTVSGSYRPAYAWYWCPFTVEVDLESGSVLGFEI